LVAAGYGAIYDASRRIKGKASFKLPIWCNSVTCLETDSLRGLRGATHGQFLDLFPRLFYETIRRSFITKLLHCWYSLFAVALFGGWKRKMPRTCQKMCSI
jgi:hypothetical protein